MKKKKTKVLLVGIVAFLLVMAVGYAIFSETINISGSAATTGSFDVEIISAEITEVGSSNATATISEDKNTLTLSAPDLKYPGASVEYTITIKNVGSLAAKLKTITKSADNDVIKVTYEDIAENDVIAVKDSKTFKVTVTWDGKSNTSSSLSYSIDLLFEQSI